MHFIKYFTILVLLAVQYSFQDDTTTYATTPAYMYSYDYGDSGFGTTQEPSSDVVYRKKRSLKSALDKAKVGAKKALYKTKKFAKNLADKTENAAEGLVDKVKLTLRKLH